MRKWLSKKNSNLFILSCLIGLFSLMYGCSKKQADEVTPDGKPGTTTPEGTVTADNVTFTNYMKGLVEGNCSSCHGGSVGQGGFTYSGYSSLVANEARIKNQVLVLKAMPKGGSLTAAQLALIKAWFDKGMPQ